MLLQLNKGVLECFLMETTAACLLKKVSLHLACVLIGGTRVGTQLSTLSSDRLWKHINQSHPLTWPHEPPTSSRRQTSSHQAGYYRAACFGLTYCFSAVSSGFLSCLCLSRRWDADQRVLTVRRMTGMGSLEKPRSSTSFWIHAALRAPGNGQCSRCEANCCAPPDRPEATMPVLAPPPRRRSWVLGPGPTLLRLMRATFRR